MKRILAAIAAAALLAAASPAAASLGSDWEKRDGVTYNYKTWQSQLMRAHHSIIDASSEVLKSVVTRNVGGDNYVVDQVHAFACSGTFTPCGDNRCGRTFTDDDVKIDTASIEVWSVTANGVKLNRLFYSPWNMTTANDCDMLAQNLNIHVGTEQLAILWNIHDVNYAAGVDAGDESGAFTVGFWFYPNAVWSCVKDTSTPEGCSRDAL